MHDPRQFFPRRAAGMLAMTLASGASSGCFLIHGSADETAEPTTTVERRPPPRTATPDAGPGEDICPTESDEDCPCGIAERFPHPDPMGRCVICATCTESCEIVVAEDAPLYPDAFLSWQAPGGAAGYGPAIIVRGAGFDGGLARVELWTQQFDFEPARGPADPPDAIVELLQRDVDELVLRLMAARTGDLPHPTPGLECYQRIFFRECTDCGPSFIIGFESTAQIRPELDCVMDWLETRVGGSTSISLPHEACDY